MYFVFKVEHNRLACAITLLSLGADVNAVDEDGNSALHFANSPAVLQALLVFGGNTTFINKNVWKIL